MKIPSPVGEVKKGSPAPSRYVINTHHLLLGDELEDAGRSSIVVEDGFIVDIMDKWVSNSDFVFDAVLPLPVNTHVHLSDLRIPEACIGLDLSGYVGRKGLKHPLIRLYREPLLTPISLDKLSILYSVGDYQELPDTCSTYRSSLESIDTIYIGLSRPLDWRSTGMDELLSIASNCGGIGVSNPTIVPSWVLDPLARVSRLYTVSAHVSETRKMERVGGLHYLLDHGVRLKHVVHGVFLEDWELRRLADEDIILVINPRSNLWFTGRIANVEKLLIYGGEFAFGTDNAGCFSLDVMVEADLFYSLKPQISPKLIVKGLTINGASALGLQPKTIELGREAYMLGVELGLPSGRTWNIYASIVKRAPYSPDMVVFKKDSIYIFDRTRYYE